MLLSVRIDIYPDHVNAQSLFDLVQKSPVVQPTSNTLLTRSGSRWSAFMMVEVSARQL
jgi:hypothetical protein